MKKWIGWRLAGAVMAASVAQLAWGQPPGSAAGAELEARLREAQENPQLAEALFKTGRKVAAVCAHCHGEGGNSLKSEIPNLAGQNPAYLLEQLRQFSDGRRRFEFMEGMIKAMKTDEKIGMVLYYAAQPVEHQRVTDSGLVARGRDYYQKICFQCHGNDGRGNQQFARIAGQQTEYLRTTLKRYRSGSGPRSNPLMVSNTRRMTDADIDAVVAYVSSMP